MKISIPPAKVVVAAFGVCAGVFAVFMLQDGAYLASAVWAAIVVAPAAALAAGVRWCRRIVGVCAILSLLFWTLLPAMQHAVDRTSGFWLMWIVGEVFLVATVWAAFSSAMKKEPNKAPEPTTMAVTSRAPSSTSRASHGRGSS